MQTQTVFKAGNSEVIAIPKHIREDLNLKSGSEIVVDKVPGIEGFIVRKASSLKDKANSKVSKSFESWLEDVLEEDGGIIDELAVR